MALKSKSGIMNVTPGSKISVIRSRRVITGNKVSPYDIIISDSKISSILPWGKQQVTAGAQLLDVGNLVVMAGIIDPHVHVNEPGRTDWEGYRTATLAAAAGGITTIVDMPLNSLPPTTSVSNFHTKLQAAKGQCYVDVGFWGGVIPNNQVELIPMLQAGVAGFKCFLINSGVPEFPHVNVLDLHAAMSELQGTNSVLLFHAELDMKHAPETGDPTLYETFLDSRPDDMEVAAVELVAELCLQYKVRCHIVHLSSAQSLPIIRKAKEAGAPLTVETTHHYLSLSSEHIPPGATYYKCCPPVRGHLNKEALWNALMQGHIDMVVSDHSPCTPDLKCLKEGDYMKAWGGISSLQFGLSLFWTSARIRGFSLTDVSHLLSSNTAKLCGFENHKGSIKVGYDADLVIWDPDKEFQVQEKDIHHKNKLTPYLGFLLQGEVTATLVRGTMVYYKGSHVAQPYGELVLLQTVKSERPSAPYY